MLTILGRLIEATVMMKNFGDTNGQGQTRDYGVADAPAVQVMVGYVSSACVFVWGRGIRICPGCEIHPSIVQLRFPGPLVAPWLRVFVNVKI